MCLLFTDDFLLFSLADFRLASESFLCTFSRLQYHKWMEATLLKTMKPYGSELCTTCVIVLRCNLIYCLINSYVNSQTRQERESMLMASEYFKSFELLAAWFILYWQVLYLTRSVVHSTCRQITVSWNCCIIVLGFSVRSARKFCCGQVQSKFSYPSWS